MNKSRIIIPAVALLVGIGVGIGAAPGPNSSPQECLDALDSADLLIGTSLEVFDLTGGHLRDDAAIWGGMAEGDYSALHEGPAKMREFSRKISALTESITDHNYSARADACRGK